MDDLLTTKQVEDLLQVDRTTIYRMLNDGRLTGIKVGQQWRFMRSEIDALLGIEPQTKVEPSAPYTPLNPQYIPTECAQKIQDVFAEIAEIGAISTTLNGEPITSPSIKCEFCRLIHQSESGWAACKESWQKLGSRADIEPEEFFTCHAGLNYSRAGIYIDQHLSSILIAGQFNIEEPDQKETEERVKALAEKHSIDAQELLEACHTIPVLDQRLKGKIGVWLRRVASAFSEMGRERAELMRRLQLISEMSKISLIE